MIRLPTPHDSLLQELSTLLPQRWWTPGSNDSVWIAGSAARQAIENPFAIPSDFDFFFSGPETFRCWRDATLALPTARLIKDEFHAVEIEMKLLKPGTQFASDHYVVKLQAFRARFFHNLAALFHDFDFTICQFAFDGFSFWADSEQAVADADAKYLRPRNVVCPLGTMRRVVKYHDKGFRFDDDTLKTILRAVAIEPELAEVMPVAGTNYPAPNGGAA